MRPAARPVTHALEGIKVLDLGNFLAGPFGPMLLGCFAAAALIPAMTQLRIARPWPGLLLLRDKQYPTIVAEIDRRRAPSSEPASEPITEAPPSRREES